jgi:transcriptional regulator with XRE-family HTH domain
MHKSYWKYVILPPYTLCTRKLPFTYMKYESLPNTLKENRKRLGLKQLEVAKKLGINSAERISMWEKGKSFPGIVNLFKLAALYDQAPENLYSTLFKEFKLPRKHEGFDTTVLNR